MSGAATGRLADCLGDSATLVSYGRMSGEPCELKPEAFIFRDLTLRGFSKEAVASAASGERSGKLLVVPQR